MSDTPNLEGRVYAIERGLLELKLSVTHEMAPRTWVHELVQPIVDNTRETRHAVEMQARDMQTFIAAHNKVMEERAEQEKKEHEARMAALEAQTWSNILKNKWAPVATFIVALAVILNYAASALLNWMSLHGVASLPGK